MDVIGLERVAGIEPASSAWKAAALPLCYTRETAWWTAAAVETRGGGSRTRTYEGVRQRIYSPPPLPLGTFPRALDHPSKAFRSRAPPMLGHEGTPVRGPKTERVL